MSIDGTNNNPTVGEAIENAPNFSDKPYVIKVKAGIYEESLNITRKTNIMIIGDGREKAKITGNRSLNFNIGMILSILCYSLYHVLISNLSKLLLQS